MPVATVNAFFEVLEKSRVFSPEQLTKLRESFATATDPKSAAIRLVKDGVLTRWQASMVLAGSSQLVLGKYQLQNQIGSGKTGKVYLARHADMGRHVAIKTLPRGANAAAKNEQDFFNQARRLCTLDHPNLIHTFDADSEAERLYLVMEYFRGEDLQTVVEREGPLDARRAAEIVRQVAEGLAHAAEKGLTHGDVRPSSLAVDGAGRVKVLHLGVLPLAGPTVNTLDPADPAAADYSAPEFTGGDATEASDIYSLGCVFYFLLTGAAPFAEGDFAERRRQHASLPPVAVISRRPDAPPELAKLCQRMLAKTPGNRPASSQEVAASLTAWLEKNPLSGPQRSDNTRDHSKAQDNQVTKPVPSVEEPASAATPESAAATSPEITPSALPTFDLGKARPAKAKSKAVAKPSVPAPLEAKSPAAASKVDSKKPLSKGLLIGLGAGGGVAVLALVILGVMFALGGGDDDAARVAQADVQEQAQAKAEVVDGEMLDEETLDGELFSSSDDEPEAAAAVNESPANEPGNAVEPPAEATDVAEVSSMPAAEEASAPASDVASSPPANATAASVEPQPPAPSEDVVAEAAAAEPAANPQTTPAEATPLAANTTDPAEEPASTKKPKSKKKEEASSDAKKAAPKAPAQVEPFAEFAQDAISLPPLEESAATTPAPLAVVHDDPETGCFLRLVGGETAHKGREVFSIEPDDPSFRNRSWTAYAGQSDAASGSGAPIARFTLSDQDQLMFQWAANANKDVANYLRNCLLNITIGSKSKEVALREPVIIEPLALTLDKAITREQFDLEWVPDPDQVQIQITGLEGAFPKHTLTPPPALKAAKGELTIPFGDPPNHIFSLQIRSTLTRKLGLTVAPFLLVGNQPVKFTPQALQQVAMQAQMQYQAMNTAVTQKQVEGREKERVEQLLPQQQTLATLYGEFANNAAQLKEGAKMHFRVFCPAGQRELELLKTGAAAGVPAAATDDASKLPGIRPAKEK